MTMKPYVIKQGDYLTRIAHRLGFVANEVWNDPKNAELKALRSDPDTLKSGDIVFVPSRDTDVYYTGGLMPPREVPLPRDNDIRVLEAILRVGGPVNNGGVLIGNFAGTSAFARGIGNPRPSLVTVLRKTPGGGQVRGVGHD